MQQLLMMMIIMNLHLLFHVLQLIFLIFIIPGTYCVLLAWAGIAIVMIYYFLCVVWTRRRDAQTTVEQLTFKMNNFPPRRFLRAVLNFIEFSSSPKLTKIKIE